MNIGEIYAKFRLDTGDFKASVGDVTSGLKNVGTGAQVAVTPINNLGSSIQSMAMKAAAAFGLYKLGDVMTSLIKESTLLSARVETLGVVMGTVGRNVGLNASQMEQYAQGVAKMGITTQVSRDTVVRMVQAQMDLTNATKLARISQDAAVIGNTNSSDALQKMIYGIQTGQIEVLKTIGLNVNFESSYMKLAAQLGKTSNDLTELEKVQARTNVVMEAGTRIAGTYESAMGTVGKQLNTLPRYIEEVKVKFGELFAPALGAIVTGLTESFKKLGDWFADPQNQAHIDAWKGRFKYLGEAISGVAVSASDLFIWMGRLGSQPGATEKQVKLSEEFIKNQQEIFNLQKKSTSEWSKFKDDLWSISDIFGTAVPVAKELLGYDDKRLERLKARNIEILNEYKNLGKVNQLEREGAAWQAFGGAGIYPGEQKFDTGTIEGMTAKQRGLQEKLNADIAALQDDMFLKFANEYDQREKIIGKDANLNKSLNEWAALETEKIWRENDEKIAALKQKSIGDLLAVIEKEQEARIEMRNEIVMGEKKLRDEIEKNNNDAANAALQRNYDEIEDQLKAISRGEEQKIQIRANFKSEYENIGKTTFDIERLNIQKQVEIWEQAQVDKIKIAEWTASKLKNTSRDENVARLGFYEDNVGKVAGTFQKIAQAGGRYSEQAFRIYQGFAIIEAGIGAAKAIVMALGSPPGPPYSYITAAVTGAMAATQIAMIATAKPPTYDEGGVSNKPGIYYAGIPEAHIPLKSGRVPVDISGGTYRSGNTFIIHMENPTFQDQESQMQVMTNISAMIARQVASDAVVENYENDGRIRQMVRRRM